MLTAKSSCTNTTIHHNKRAYTHSCTHTLRERETERERYLLHGTRTDVFTILIKQSIAKIVNTEV